MYVSGDATGLPMRKEELEGVVGKQEDGSAKTSMIYGGCVFTQTKTDQENFPVTHPMWKNDIVLAGIFRQCLQPYATG